MKTKTFALALFCALVFAACKKDGDATETKGEAPKVEKERFSVDLDVIAEKEDNFSVYYTEDGTINFNGDKAIWSGVKGGGQSEHLVFDFPEEIIPTNIRFDFGLNKEQGDVTLQKFKLTFYGKSFEARGSDFNKYFIPNDSIKTEIDQAAGTIKFLKNPKGYNPPFFYPQQAVLDEIAKITK